MIELYLIHPMLVHFTIALFFLSVLFDILGAMFKKDSFITVGWYNLLFAGLSVIATVSFGLVAASKAPHTDAGHALLETHETFGFIVLGIILVLAIWRIVLKGKLPVKALALYFIISIVGMAFMSIGAYYGAEMVYTHGFGVKAATQATEHMHGEAGHEHGQTDMEEHHQQMDDSTHMHQGEVHEHSDGSTHVH